ncbi:transcription factor MYB113-like [Pyrus ussuriensis x Pyrus communis]|uniref:Transcription factor MYB113-like n=1 Tax=Pyrus ussuriensis x Pyrus communis TaxID=2448454 RepID=A0A5N5HFD3_9ROSA|nr:transcription factor MYB113-like [Pyrus ussuriensis x Pyrus communis]
MNKPKTEGMCRPKIRSSPYMDQIAYLAEQPWSSNGVARTSPIAPEQGDGSIATPSSPAPLGAVKSMTRLLRTQNAIGRKQAPCPFYRADWTKFKRSSPEFGMRDVEVD